MKDRTYVDVRKQRKKAVPRNSTPPTVSMESVLIKSTFDAHEGRKVGVRDILDAFLSAYTDEDVKMALRGRLSELMIKI